MCQDQSIRKFEYAYFINQHLNVPHDSAYFMADEKTFGRLENVYFPYRNFFYGVGIIQEGEAEFVVGSTTYHLGPQTVVTIGPGILRQWKSGYTTLKQEVLFFTSEIFLRDFNAQFLHQFPFFKPEARHCHRVSAEKQRKVALFLDLIRQERLPSLVPGLIYSLLNYLLEICPLRADEIAHQTDSAARITDTFKLLLDQYYLDHRSVAFYADQIHISPKYLSETVKKITGKSPKAWINEMLMNEAKSLLKQTPLSIKEIAFQLGYQDDSYFIKIFKKHEGSTPQEYRQQSP